MLCSGTLTNTLRGFHDRTNEGLLDSIFALDAFASEGDDDEENGGRGSSAAARDPTKSAPAKQVSSSPPSESRGGSESRATKSSAAVSPSSKSQFSKTNVSSSTSTGAAAGSASATAADPERGLFLPCIQIGQTLLKREKSEAYMPHLRCRYRLSQASVHILVKYQTKRRLEFVDRAAFLHFLRQPVDEGIPLYLSSACDSYPYEREGASSSVGGGRQAVTALLSTAEAGASPLSSSVDSIATSVSVTGLRDEKKLIGLESCEISGSEEVGGVLIIFVDSGDFSSGAGEEGAVEGRGSLSVEEASPRIYGVVGMINARRLRVHAPQESVDRILTALEEETV